MSSQVLIEQLDVHSDRRGTVYEPLAPEHLPSQRNVHVVVTAAGHVRGNHYHRRGIEMLTVLGPALVRVREGQQLTDTEIATGEGYRFVIPPGIGHAIRATGPEPMLIVAFNSEVFDREQPDVVRDLLLE